MKAILITYQLRELGNTEIIINKIKSFSTWAKINDNAWIIITNKEIGEVRDEVANGLGEGINLLAIDVTHKGWGSYAISTEVTDWMKKNLKQNE